MRDLPHTTPDSWSGSFLAFRERHAGSIHDVCSALAMLAFLGVAGFWIVVL